MASHPRKTYRYRKKAACKNWYLYLASNNYYTKRPNYALFMGECSLWLYHEKHEFLEGQRIATRPPKAIADDPIIAWLHKNDMNQSMLAAEMLNRIQPVFMGVDEEIPPR